MKPVFILSPRGSGWMHTEPRIPPPGGKGFLSYPEPRAKKKGRAPIGARPCLQTSPEAYLPAALPVLLPAADIAFDAEAAAAPAALVAAAAALPAAFWAAM